MNTKRPVKLIKRHERTPRQRRGTVPPVVGPNKWSKSVRSWVVEFKERDRSTDASGLPAFDSLFKDALLQPEGAD
jgi:hypothetical protein